MESMLVGQLADGKSKGGLSIQFGRLVVIQVLGLRGWALEPEHHKSRTKNDPRTYIEVARCIGCESLHVSMNCFRTEWDLPTVRNFRMELFL